MDMKMSINQQIIKYSDGELVETTDDIVTEFPLTIFVNNEEFATMVCTPTHFEEMVIGFLASEGVIRFYNEVESISIDENAGYAYVSLHSDVTTSHQHYSKRFIG